MGPRPPPGDISFLPPPDPRRDAGISGCLATPNGFLLAKHPSGWTWNGASLPYLNVEEGGKPLPQVGLGVTAQVPVGTRCQRPVGTAGCSGEGTRGHPAAPATAGDDAGPRDAEVSQSPGDRRGQVRQPGGILSGSVGAHRTPQPRWRVPLSPVCPRVPSPALTIAASRASRSRRRR